MMADILNTNLQILLVHIAIYPEFNKLYAAEKPPSDQSMIGIYNQ